MIQNSRTTLINFNEIIRLVSPVRMTALGWFLDDPPNLIYFTVYWVNIFQDDATKWKKIPRHWPFVGGIQR